MALQVGGTLFAWLKPVTGANNANVVEAERNSPGRAFTLDSDNSLFLCNRCERGHYSCVCGDFYSGLRARAVLLSTLWALAKLSELKVPTKQGASVTRQARGCLPLDPEDIQSKIAEHDAKHPREV